MFDFPLSLPAMEAYARLGLGPAATEGEIAEAKLDLTNRLRSRKSDVDRQLEAVYRAVSGLRETSLEVNRIKESERDESLDELRIAEARLARLEQEALRVEPRFAALREESADLERQIHAVNLLPVGTSKDRHEYDQANPPLALLKLVDCRTDHFADNQVALRLVRRELERFLAAMGEPVAYPSDLTREDFIHDFTFNPNLDGPAK